MFVTLILQLIGTFQVFTEPFLLTDGGPADSTVTSCCSSTAMRSVPAVAVTTARRRR